MLHAAAVAVFGSKGKALTTVQLHIWSLLIGAVLGAAIVGYQSALQGIIELLWRRMADAWQATGLAPIWIVNFIIPVVFGGFLAGALLHVAARFDYGTGSIVTAIRAVHSPGIVPLKHFLPMLVISLVTITAGGSAGPEAAVIVLGAAACSLIGQTLLDQPLRERRILTLVGMASCLAAFFGVPLTGAIFVLEVPHHNGLEYFEAISPTVSGRRLCASVVSSLMVKLITQRSLGGLFTYNPLMGSLNYVDLCWAGLLGLLAGVTAYIFTWYMKLLKRTCEKFGLTKWKFTMSVMGSILVGAIGIISPSSLFWSENELQWALTMGNTTLPFARHSGVIPFHSPLLGWEMAVIGIFKLLAIGVTVGIAQWPGGIIFPLFFSGAALGSAWATLLGIDQTLGAVCFMGALEASVLRTPWAAVLIILLSQGGEGGGYFLEVFPPLIIAVMIAMVGNYWSRLYGAEQHGRRDFIYGVMPPVDPHTGDIQEDGEEDKLLQEHHNNE